VTERGQLSRALSRFQFSATIINSAASAAAAEEAARATDNSSMLSTDQ